MDPNAEALPRLLTDRSNRDAKPDGEPPSTLPQVSPTRSNPVIRAGRVARWFAWGIVGIAGLVLPCVTILVSSVNRQGRDVAERIATLRRLEWIERYGFELAGVATKRVGNPSEAAPHEQFEERLRALESTPREEPEFRQRVDRIGATVRLLETRDAREAEPGARMELLAALLEDSGSLETRLRGQVSDLSRDLADQSWETNLLALLSCALSVTLALLLFAYDRSVMDRRKAEEGEQELREELAHVGRLSVVGEMGTKIAHELNQPLGAIQNYIAGCVRRLRQHDGDPQEVIGALEKAKRETERASAIIRGLREFARHSEGRWSVVGVNDLVHEVLPLLSAELRESRIEPELELSEGLEPVHADRIQIEQVLVNLIRNSIEAMSGTPAEERRLIVKTGRTSDRGIEVQVEDTGCGLHPDLLPNLFQPFHTTKPKGMGIGLAISRTIVEAHEGTIRAEPRRGRGAVFRFQLPCPSMVVTA
jgi:signal transduction histidine kinase